MHVPAVGGVYARCLRVAKNVASDTGLGLV